MFCKNCGKVLSADAKFCSECGTKVEVEAPKPKVEVAPEPIFFTREPEVKKEKPKKVVHLDEFSWDLDGYPTAPKKTEDVDFNWASVLEEKARVSVVRTPSVKPVEVVEETSVETPEEPVITVEELVEELPEDFEVEVDVTTDVVEEAPSELEAEIFEHIERDQIEEPTKLIDKAQMKAGGVDQFYAFNQKQAEMQAVLDEEYARIQNGEFDEDEAIDAEPVVLPEILQPEVTVETLMEELVIEEPQAEMSEPELVGVVWASAPAGVLVDTEEVVAEVAEEPAEAIVEEIVEEIVETVSPSKSEEPEDKEPETKLTFDDIFRDDDDDDEEEKEKGGCLKVIAILLCILVVLELGILGIQYFAPNSTAGAYIDQAYSYIVNLIHGSEPEEHPEEVSGPSEVQQMITKQMEKNENIGSIVENKQLFFEEGEDYGYAEFGNTYAFQNSPWYENEAGESVTFGDEIIGTILQYYSALTDKKNNVNNDIVDFVEHTSAFYEEVEAIEGFDDLQYVINNLEIGEIRTGASGFYVLVRTNTVDLQHPEGEMERQVVYLEPNVNKNTMKIIEIQKI